MITTHQAKRVVREALERYGLGYTKLTARTVSFTDLARGEALVVTIHGWGPSPDHELVRQAARAQGVQVYYPLG